MELRILTTKDLLYSYLYNEISRAQSDLDYIRDRRYLLRDEVDLLEEILALNKLKVLNQVTKDIFTLIRTKKS